MDDVQSFPFQSWGRLQEWRESDKEKLFDDHWIEEVLMPGMKKHFKSEDPVVHVCDHVELTEQTFYVDIHMELEDSKGDLCQPWVLTFITKSKAEDERLRFDDGSDAIFLDDLDTPFPAEDIIWDCNYFTEEEILKAMNAWSEKFWPDAELEFQYAMVDDNLKWLRNMIQEALDKGEFDGLPEGGKEDLQEFADSQVHILGPPQEVDMEIVTWLEDNNYPILYELTEGALIRCPTSIAELVESKWENVYCKPAFQNQNFEE